MASFFGKGMVSKGMQNSEGATDLTPQEIGKPQSRRTQRRAFKNGVAFFFSMEAVA
jgi:hypothetical protein